MARRTRALFLNARAAEAMAPEAARLMATELGWDEARQSREAAAFSVLAKSCYKVTPERDTHAILASNSVLVELWIRSLHWLRAPF